jgi:hypothetical protein
MTSELGSVILVTTAAYFGLAILGGGGFAVFFSHPALVALAIVTLALALAAGFAGGNLNPGVREDRANRWVIAALMVIGSPSAAYCGFGRSMCSATTSAVWSPSSPGTHWSPAASMASSAIRVILDC